MTKVVAAMLALGFACIAIYRTQQPDEACLVVESLFGEEIARYERVADLPETVTFDMPVHLRSPGYHLTISFRPPGWGGYRQPQYFPYGNRATCLGGEYFCAFHQSNLDGSGAEPRLGEIRVVVRTGTTQLE